MIGEREKHFLNKKIADIECELNTIENKVLDIQLSLNLLKNLK